MISYGHPAAVNPKILPPELGGAGESYAQLANYWRDYAQQNAEWFVTDDEFKSKAPDTVEKLIDLGEDCETEMAAEAC